MNNNITVIDYIKLITKPILIGAVVFFLFQGLYWSIEGRDPTLEDQLLLGVFSTGLLFIGYSLTGWLYDLIKMMNMNSGRTNKQNEIANIKSIKSGTGITEYINKNAGYKYITNVDYITTCNERVKDENLQENQMIYLKKYNYTKDLNVIIERLDKQDEKNIKKREKADRRGNKDAIEKNKLKVAELKEHRDRAKELIVEINTIETVDGMEEIEPIFKKFKYKFKKTKIKYVKQSELLSFTSESLDINEKLNNNTVYRFYMDWGRVFIPTLLIAGFFLYFEFVPEDFIDKTLQQGIQLILASLGIGMPFSIIWGMTGRFKNKYLTPTEELALFYNSYLNTIEKE